MHRYWPKYWLTLRHTNLKTDRWTIKYTHCYWPKHWQTHRHMNLKIDTLTFTSNILTLLDDIFTYNTLKTHLLTLYLLNPNIYFIIFLYFYVHLQIFGLSAYRPNPNVTNLALFSSSVQVCCIVLYCIVLYHIVLYCTMYFSIVLY